MAKQRRGIITTKRFLAILSEFNINIKSHEGGYKFINPKTKKTSCIHVHSDRHELNPSIIKKTVTWLGLDINEFNAKA